VAKSMGFLVDFFFKMPVRVGLAPACSLVQEQKPTIGLSCIGSVVILVFHTDDLESWVEGCGIWFGA